MGRLLGLLFEITAIFDMRLRPELVLLQKTMVTVEGVARRIDPNHDIWRAAEPVVRRWITRELRQGLGFGGLVFADDLSMTGAAAVGNLPERAGRALAAGCDVLPVCNDRAGVETLLQQFKPRMDPASQLRLIRMRGRKQLDFETLEASAAWRSAREWLERSAAKPELRFEPGDAGTGAD